MIVLAYYLLKVFICSAILYSYYSLALRNKAFHYWNRFYLLGAVMLSISLPLLRIPILIDTNDTPVHSIPLVKVVNSGDTYVEQITSQSGYMPGPSELILFSFGCISLVLLFFLIRTFMKIKKMLGHYEIIPMNGMAILNTTEPGTPFSFMKYIFWNQSIPADSPPGSQILKHEIVHVQQKHTYDKIFLQLVHIFFWINPVFWLIRREIAMIHEFIADKEAIENSDTSAFAAMILQAAYPGHQFPVGNYFFHSPVKRRLKMLLKSSNPRQSYITRLLALPLLVIIVAGFTLKTVHKKDHAAFPENRMYTVVIDAGHGGKDVGARATDGSVEKNFTLAIARKLKALNKHPQLNIVLTREEDVYHPVSEILSKTLQLKPDVFLALHINAAPQENKKGFEVYISNKITKNESSVLLGSTILNEVGKITAIEKELKKRNPAKLYLLDAPEVNYPAVLIECGYITNLSDLHFIQSDKNQDQIAESILKGIEKFIILKNSSATADPTTLSDTLIPSSKIILQATSFYFGGKLDNPAPPLIIVNGKERNLSDIHNVTITADSIVSYPENDKEGIALYGNKAKNGVMIFYNAKISTPQLNRTDSLPKGVKSVDITASGEVIVIFNNGKAEKMSGADAQHKGYIPLAVLEKSVPPTFSASAVRIRSSEPQPLIVIDGIKQKPGTDIQSLELDVKPDDIESLEVLKDARATALYGDDAKNGVLIITTKKNRRLLLKEVETNSDSIELTREPIEINELEITEEPAVTVVFKKPEKDPEFTGGPNTLNKFISAQLNELSPAIRNDLKGECEIELVVRADGSVGDFKLIKTKSSNINLAKKATTILKNGPKWKPAMQNGKQVNAFYKFTYVFK